MPKKFLLLLFVPWCISGMDLSHKLTQVECEQEIVTLEKFLRNCEEQLAFMDNLKGAAKWTLIGTGFGSIGYLWQRLGQSPTPFYTFATACMSKAIANGYCGARPVDEVAGVTKKDYNVMKPQVEAQLKILRSRLQQLRTSLLWKDRLRMRSDVSSMNEQMLIKTAWHQ